MISSKAFFAEVCDFRNMLLFIYLFNDFLKSILCKRFVILEICSYLFIYLFSQKYSLQRCVILEIFSDLLLIE